MIVVGVEEGDLEASNAEKFGKFKHGSKTRPSPVRLGRVVSASSLTASSRIPDTIPLMNQQKSDESTAFSDESAEFSS